MASDPSLRQAVGERGFSVVNVRDDRKISDAGCSMGWSILTGGVEERPATMFRGTLYVRAIGMDMYLQ
jgi:hypothetical protein